MFTSTPDSKLCENPAGVVAEALPHWFAVYSNARHEKHVCTQLSRQGIETFLPLYQVVHRWKNRCLARVDLPLFPCYLFVRVHRSQYKDVLNASGVLALVGRNREPEPLLDEEIESLRSAVQQCKIQPHPLLTVGERARIRNGPFAGMEGVLVRNKSNYRVVLTLDLIMRSMALEVDADDLEPVVIR